MFKRGFTLVELLIVIVIIAILAAITIVAYNGIQQRAHLAVLQNDLSEAAQFFETYNAQNGQYPSSLGAAEDPAQTNGSPLKLTTPNNQLIYSVNNAANPATWGLTATDSSSGQSYYINNTTQSSPKSGIWITNMALDPRGIGNGGEYSARFGFGSSWVTGASDGPASASGLNSYARKTFISGSTSGSGRGIDIHGNIDTSSDSDNSLPVLANTPYYVSVYTRASESNSALYLSCRPHDGSGAWFDSQTQTTSINYTANQWQRLSETVTPSANGYLACTIRFGGATTYVLNDTMDATGLLVAQGTGPYNYVDGNSTGWIWNGTALGNETSTGPAL